ncbi:hypothetical protein G4H71_03980 [Rhodococcus triatomae]|uniref:Uncharacterized protein n=1 Tax=Rhodococcus triatomae TaxID=300028 RepID=A0A1G7ZIR6_9NOCA|nr:hypothetical protein [Rhodococcus triatomae]QNG18030.1 hypothetical protein G4H72_04060 [Rhodococcus triatomae]QNG22300.1 hypothetical protein G4H71_03980 [Rhodococcus triatomae]SDH08505.1 hypothetical protein SAMN05444695_101122 [Rhodococcus triatomae]
MNLFRRRAAEPTPRRDPTAFVAEILHRIGEQYGGFDAIAPFVPDAGGPGMEVTIHIAGPSDPERESLLQGTGIIRTVRVFADRSEVYDGARLIASFDDLTTADVFGTGR